MFNEIALHNEHAERQRRLTAVHAGRRPRRERQDVGSSPQVLDRLRLRWALTELRRRRVTLRRVSVIRT